MQSIRRKLERIASTSIPVLVQGESGTGKDLCARLIHELSLQSGHHLVKVSCPAIPSHLLETELFGYDRGAFTGANGDKRGRLERADQGTLFLDDIDALDLSAQAKLLQVLQDGTYSHVGGHETFSVKTRVVSATNKDLKQQVDEGVFRLDLLYRINAITVQLLPLRQRPDDLPELIDYFLDDHSQTLGVTRSPLQPRILRLLQSYPWPGNLRQLDNVLRGYVLLGSEEELIRELSTAEAPTAARALEVDLSRPLNLKSFLKTALHDMERQIIVRVLRANGWNRQKTAKWLQISYRSLLYKLEEMGPEALPHSRRAALDIEEQG